MFMKNNAIVSRLTDLFVLQHQQNSVLKNKKKEKKSQGFFHSLKVKGSSLKIMN